MHPVISIQRSQPNGSPVHPGLGGAQLVHRLDDGYLDGSDHRKNGQAVGF